MTLSEHATPIEAGTVEPIEFPDDAKHFSEYELAEQDCRFRTDRYTSPEFHRREIEKLWLNVWQLACREDEVARPGDFCEYRIGSQSYLVVRGKDGQVRAFHNVCKHRGNPLREGSGSVGDSLVCNFHLWSYNLDGSLRSVSDRESFCPISDADYGLTAVAADCWGGWVFIHPNPAAAPPLLEFLAPLPEQFAGHQLDRLVPVGLNATTYISANWKVAMEAFLEVYHTQGVHPQLLPTFDDYDLKFQTYDTGHNRMVVPFIVPSPHLGEGGATPDDILEAMFGFESGAAQDKMHDGVDIATGAAEGDDRRASASGALGDYFTSADAQAASPLAVFEQYRNEAGEIEFPEGITLRQIMKDMARGALAAKGVELRGFTSDMWVDDWHTLVFPNSIINYTATSVLFFRFLPDWDDPEKCRWDIVTFEYFSDPEQAAAARAKHITFGEREQTLGLILDQDAYQIPRIQQGMRSEALEHVLFSKQEIRLIHFNRTIDRYMSS